MNMTTDIGQAGIRADGSIASLERLRDKAAAAFCASGFRDADLDGVLRKAALTRPEFDAQFASKEALFLDILTTRNVVLRALRQRDDNDSDVLWHQMRGVFSDYLGPDLGAMRRRCPMARLQTDAARQSPMAARAILRSTAAVQEEMVRGQPIAPDDSDITAALLLATGAAAQAAVCRSEALSDAVLAPSLAVFLRLTSAARHRGRITQGH